MERSRAVQVVQKVEALAAQDRLRGDLLRVVLVRILDGVLDPHDTDQTLAVLPTSLIMRITVALGG